MPCTPELLAEKRKEALYPMYVRLIRSLGIHAERGEVFAVTRERDLQGMRLLRLDGGIEIGPDEVEVIVWSWRPRFLTETALTPPG